MTRRDDTARLLPNIAGPGDGSGSIPSFGRSSGPMPFRRESRSGRMLIWEFGVEYPEQARWQKPILFDTPLHDVPRRHDLQALDRAGRRRSRRARGLAVGSGECRAFCLGRFVEEATVVSSSQSTLTKPSENKLVAERIENVRAPHAGERFGVNDRVARRFQPLDELEVALRA